VQVYLASSMDDLGSTLAAIQREATQAETRYGAPASTHESLGVLLEEFDELRAAIHANNVVAIRDEAVQVAAVALRLAVACQLAHEAEGDPTHFARRSFPWAQ
jgi:NTP pyrophosphatase (non-canonical NTP hydrolase)